MAIKIEASTRIKAAEATEEASKKFLTTLSFKGLTLKEHKDDLITFHYTGYDEAKVAKKLGEPKDTKGDSIRYNFAGVGVVAIWPSKQVVVLRNSKRN